MEHIVLDWTCLLKFGVIVYGYRIHLFEIKFSFLVQNYILQKFVYIFFCDKSSLEVVKARHLNSKIAFGVR